MQDQFSLFAADSPASRTLLPGSKEAQMISAHSGRKCSELYAKYSPLGSLVKTLLGSSVWNSTKCYLIWKVRTTPCRRLIFRLAESMPTTYAIESGLLPTPAATEYGSNQGGGAGRTGPKRYGLSSLVKMMWPTPTLNGNYNRKGLSKKSGDGLATAVKVMWPTPKSRDCRTPGGEKEKQRNTPYLPTQVGGSLNPAWVEWLMGYPAGWTDLED